MEPRGLERFRGRQLGFVCAWRCRAQGAPDWNLRPPPSGALLGGLSKYPVLGPFLLSDNRHFWYFDAVRALPISWRSLRCSWLSVPLQAGTGPAPPMQLSRTDMYRMKAIACEHRASDASDPTSKQDWAELAIEWHAMAYREDYTDEPQRC